MERQEEQKLAAITSKIAQIRAEIGACGQRRSEVRRVALHEVAGGSSGAVLQFAVVCDEAAAELEKKLKSQLRTVEMARARQLEVYRQARQKREVFERFRERQSAAYEREALRRAQEEVDENFLIGLSRERED